MGNDVSLLANEDEDEANFIVPVLPKLPISFQDVDSLHASNANGPIARIPVEILAKIFHILCKDLSGERRWTYILEVCTYWRAVALATARLWTRISNDESHTRLKRSLLLSQQCPLHVVITPDGNITLGPFIKALLPYAHRIETVSAALFLSAALSKLITMLPNVRVVSIESKSTQLVFPFVHFTEAAVVQLRDTDVAFNSKNLKMLTTLSIVNPSGLPTLLNILSVIREAPALESLVLTGPMRGHAEGSVNVLPRTQPVRMCNLRSGILCTQAAFTSAFFTVFVVPASARIGIQVQAPKDRDEAGRNPFIRAFPDKSLLKNVGCLLHADRLLVDIKCEPGITCRDTKSGGAVGVYVVANDYPTAWKNVVNDILQAVELSELGQHITTLGLRGDKERALDLTSLFRALPNVHTLKIDAGNIDNVLTALSSIELFSEQENWLLCPNLRELELRDVDMDDEVITKISECFQIRSGLCGYDLGPALLYDPARVEVARPEFMGSVMNLLLKATR
ncbi:hypothetical protein EUX98_g2272 [Antrodiella citrinella]|uniref:Uncharacterized protein n=1 Tax=Antrodiella citrinella TaxID=2447956 RepID=A0A4S4MZF0_9APHY|nr:hypothetical protein EUX98_g2272 [Antrodiella citrinella]